MYVDMVISNVFNLNKFFFFLLFFLLLFAHPGIDLAQPAVKALRHDHGLLYYGLCTNHNGHAAIKRFI